MAKPRIFIGSSAESLNTAKLLQTALSSWSYPEIWSQGFFDSSGITSIESLMTNLPSYDYSVILITPDDKSRVRSKEYFTPRDNIIFELGLSMGCIGRDRTYMVQPNNITVKLPSDLLGTSPIKYDPSAPNLIADFGVVSTKIEMNGKKKLTNPSVILKNT